MLLPLAMCCLHGLALGGRFLHGGSARWAIGGGLLTIGAGDLLQTGLGPGSGWPALLAGLTVTGIGVGLATPTLVSTGMATVPSQHSGMAAGAVNTARQLGLALGIAILGSVYNAGSHHTTRARPLGDLPHRRHRRHRRRHDRADPPPPAHRDHDTPTGHHDVGEPRSARGQSNEPRAAHASQ